MSMGTIRTGLIVGGLLESAMVVSPYHYIKIRVSRRKSVFLHVCRPPYTFLPERFGFGSIGGRKAKGNPNPNTDPMVPLSSLLHPPSSHKTT